MGEGPGAYALISDRVETLGRGGRVRGLTFALSRRVHKEAEESRGLKEQLPDRQQLKDGQAEGLSKDFLEAPQTWRAGGVGRLRGKKRGRSSRDLP
jgi:hypothetical protein